MGLDQDRAALELELEAWSHTSRVRLQAKVGAEALGLCMGEPSTDRAGTHADGYPEAADSTLAKQQSRYTI